MHASAGPARSPGRGDLTGLYTPKLLTVLREGYGLRDLRADAIAGLTVAVVALPLSMAIAIAAGTTPDRGLYTAIVGGFLVSALGGSRFQIGGPAGAFIVLVASTVARHGMDGLVLATLLAGLMLAAAGALRLGTFVKFVPYPVTVGFTAGIAVIIFASQVHELFGLVLSGPEPGPIIPKLLALGGAAGTWNPAAVGITALTVTLILAAKRWRPRWPGLLIGVVAATVVTALAGLPVETIGSRFGGIPQGIPVPGLPEISVTRILAVLPDAAAFALLGAIESLLSAVVADGMTGRRHRSNCELVAQGVANVGSALFGGFCVTGTIARTATNVRAGARGPVSGMLHSLFLLAFVLVAAPLASYVPLAALAGVLAVVAWNMIEKHAFAALLRTSRGDAAILLATFGLTVFVDLLSGIVAGIAIGGIVFIYRIAEQTTVTEAPLQDMPDSMEPRPRYDAGADPDVVVYRITGAFFFGTAARVGAVLDSIAARHGTFVLDLGGVQVIDSTGAATIEMAARKAGQSGIRFVIASAAPGVRTLLETHGLTEPTVSYVTRAEAVRRGTDGAD
ncbi:MAG: SulP family inorganic anion transporter [Pseudomonadota bacterium]|nr:SulP family inorganic anion transporter [Pseudomonadota bacterium]